MIRQLRPISMVSIILLAGAANADPEVSHLSDDLSKENIDDGMRVTLHGSSFGSRAEVSLWDTVDNQSAFEDLTSGSVVPTDSGPWTTQSRSKWDKLLTIAKEADETDCFESDCYKGQKASFVGWPRIFKDMNNTSIYVSWWFKPSGDLGGSDESNKVIRIWDDSSGENTRISWTHHHMQYDAVDLGYTENTNWHTINTVADAWNRLEIWVDGETGLIKTWTNGELIHDIDDFKKSPIDKGLTVGLLGWDPNYGHRYEDFSFLMDNVYASPSQARIELSNESSWAKTKGNRNLQPIDNWDTNEITFSTRLGNLDKSEPLYVYVVTDSGKVNQEGFPLEGCEKCPDVVDDLEVK